ncbi:MULTISPECIES: naphthalene 1,2-dioxygenase system ferredoxin--NAD(P)(+) reductase NdoR [Pseudomonas]|uniref:ferredoxin--NAD(P)(+) reductase (naphthalene dioxygenase ferredoxin-specific) n=1 Tax=Pseudomonas putida TaxID=303 RepID=Q52140_PSEPU|nr:MULTISPECIES: naphthalene 1,2-dioxygenase system ferredoxin--NAD(P)(+) reductase NdoR [Pseudomonas]BAA20389.1 reductase [Pseudomonas putida]TEK45321.1 2Fe-2S iron-sulfur cluster binding domain-containing protein [Pseudomonas aeruginosa]TEK58431.1 2Fe-2S iron-sulfur cluster binding domain-containing protein [Pseudomonas aeruginosa]TEK73970.1 2Fe-2S iron-sulfur cluster binding domain-containing protein [Pseudomonas aeruginosa]TEK78427.1 2Fe-2S iron-sulfur cluster binding domain-containing pro
MKLLIQPNNRLISFSPGANLLEVLRENGVAISYSCMSGRCGTCRCRVTDGSVIDSGTGSGLPHLVDEHYVLACRSVLTNNCAIEIPEADEIVTHPARIIKGTVVAIESPTHDIRRLRVRLAKPFEFSPGQYATLQFSPEHARPYSMAGLPDDQEMEFHIRKVPGGRVTEYVFEHVREGTSIKLSGPLGTAYLRQNHTGPMLCVGGGTGLAPVLSIIRGALKLGMTNPILLYFGVRSQQDLYDAERLHNLAADHPQLTVHTVIAMGPINESQRAGLVTDAIEKDISSLAGWRAYLCGAPAMVEALCTVTKHLGISPEHIYADAFYPGEI